MKNVFFVFAGILALSATANAQDASKEESMKQCVGVMMGNPNVTRAKAEYACDNYYLEPREGDTAEQEAIRQELARDAADFKENMARPYLDNGSIDSGLASNPESLSEGRN